MTKTMFAAILAAALGAANASALGLDGLKTVLASGGASFDGKASGDAETAARPPLSADRLAREQNCLKERRRAGRHWTGYMGRRPGRAARVERVRRASATKKSIDDCNPSESAAPAV